MALLKPARWASQLLVAAGLAAVLRGGAPAGTSPPSEYEIKAIFLYRFANFVEWPEAGSRAPVCIGILGQDPFEGKLEQVVKGKTVNGRAFAIRRLKPDQSAKDCQIVFISASERMRLRSILDELRGGNVLTVSETPGFCRAGGVINFELVNDSVRFEINIDAAERAGLRLSSKLLGVARIVREPGL